MATSGKSKRPPPTRDRRRDSLTFIPQQEALGPAAQKLPRTRAEGGEPPAARTTLESDVARLKAERASDADELGAMLVRVAATERARDVAETRANGLEKWAEELEAKVAAARTRGDELEAELARVRREHAEALEVERVRRQRELAALGAQLHDGAGATPGEPSSASLAAAREAMTQVIATLEELERHESQSAVARARAFDLAREFLGRGRTTSSRPPTTKEVPTAPSTRTPPKRSRRPPPIPRPTTPALPAALRGSTAPPSLSPPTPVAPIFLAPPAPPGRSVPRSDVKLELMTFEDLDPDE